MVCPLMVNSSATFGHTAASPPLVHRKYRGTVLHSRLIDEISFVYKESYGPNHLKMFWRFFQTDFSKNYIAFCSKSGTSRLFEVDQLNGTTDMLDTNAVDVVILSNGPGEVITWVKPVVSALRQHFDVTRWKLRISVLLAPCPHASGEEMKVIQSFEEVDRCLGPNGFFEFLLLGGVVEGWDWRKKGVCIFLGGDQFNILTLGRRLGYRTIVYAEDSVRWPGLVDIYALQSQVMMKNVPHWARKTCRVVGNLVRDATHTPSHSLPSKKSLFQVAPFHDLDSNTEPASVVGILPGSKDVKLSIGVPYFVAVAEHIQERMGSNVRFILPLAPTVSLSTLERYADPSQNMYISKFQWRSAELVITKSNQHCGMVGKLVSDRGLQIEIWQAFPPYKLFKECTLCITTIGANTAELGSLGVPMVVVLPTHVLEVFRGSTGGLLGLLAKIPGNIGKISAILMNFVILKTVGFVSWPNRWAREEVVPEFIGRIEPKDIAEKAIELLESPSKLENMRETLLSVSNQHECIPKNKKSEYQDGAADAIAHIVDELMNV